MSPLELIESRKSSTDLARRLTDPAVTSAPRPGARPSRYEVPHPPSIPSWKRGLDVFLILLATPFLGPIMILITLAIKLVSKGPILFRQHRIGYAGREFELLKFRTMRADADAQVHNDHLDKLIESEAPMTKLDHLDSRLIPGGRWLRATGLDELPQLFNIFRGEMSLVGPRPCMPYEFARYDASQRCRFGALPGLTGLWQVSGKNRLSFSEMIGLDVCYVNKSSLLLDLKILIKTPRAILTQVRDTARLRQAALKGEPATGRPAV